MTKQKSLLRMDKSCLDLLNHSKTESQDIYETLCNSKSMYNKCLNLERQNITESLDNTLAAILTTDIIFIAGSSAEGTNITSEDYGNCFHSTPPCYISDVDYMHVLSHVRVTEGDTLPRRFNDDIYLRAERGKHTTDGFRKLRLIHRPEYYSVNLYMPMYWEKIINMSVDHGYMSSSKFLATSITMPAEVGKFVKMGLRTKGPSEIMEQNGSPNDWVSCFYVKTWPKEAESWFTRQTHWPDRKLKSKIKRVGYLLVPTGNRNSKERVLEWRCSFSIGEKILFQSMTLFQRCTFVLLKVLLKEYLSADINTDINTDFDCFINTDEKKQLLSTYHMKTVFLWSLEDSTIEWEPAYMLDIIGHMLGKLSAWIKKKYFPHYFIPSVNLLDGRRLHGRGKALISFISAIQNDLSNKIKQSPFFLGQEIKHGFASSGLPDDKLSFMYIQHDLLQCITGSLQTPLHHDAFFNPDLKELNLRNSMLIEGLINEKADKDQQRSLNLYSAMYNDPIHDKLLRELVPGLKDQYLGCIHLAKYCMAARDGRLLPGVLHTAESLLKDALHLDPCSGYVKLACVYMTTGDFVQAMDKLHVAENHLLLIHKNIVETALRNLQLNGVEVDRLSTEFYTIATQEVFQKWVEGQVTSSIVVTWPEYTTVPDLLQLELIQESTQQVFDVPYDHEDEPGKMVDLAFNLKWPPLSMIKLLKFVCAFNLGQSSTSHMINLVAELSLSFTACADVNDIYTVFNMAAWCYVKIKKYKPAAHMMIMAVKTSSETKIMKQCAFSHHLVAYIIAQCLL